MTDLIYGILVIAALSLMMFLLGLMIGRAAPHWLSDLTAGATIVGIVLYIRFLWDNILLAKLLPCSNLIVLGNWLPLGASLLGGLAFRRIGGGLRKVLYVVALTGAAAFGLGYPLYGNPPVCENEWINGVCLQTSEQTCSPASAATLLAQYDIPATEQEMAELCLTRQGTNWQGVYRGLKLKTAGTEWDVHVFGNDADDLPLIVRDGPAILSVGLPAGADADSIYATRYGFKPGLGHSVVLMQFPSAQTALVADPSVADGLELWSLADLRVLYRGQGLQLLPRSQMAQGR